MATTETKGALRITVESTLTGQAMTVAAEDNHSYAGGKVTDTDTLEVTNPVWSEGVEDPKATSKFAEFRMSDVSDGDVFVFGRHAPTADLTDWEAGFDAADELLAFEIRDGEVVEADA